MRKLGVVIFVLMGLFSISLALTRLNTQHVTSSSFFDFFALNVPAVSLFLFGVPLIIFRERLAFRLFSDASFNTLVDGVHIVRLGFIFLGLFLATVAFSAMIVNIIASYEYSKLDDTFVATPGFWETFSPNLIGDIFEFACGLFFIIGSMALSRRVWSLQRVEVDDNWDNVSACPVCHEPFDPADYRPDIADPKCLKCGMARDMSGTNESAIEDEEFEYECDECGSIVGENDKTCPTCGANIEEVEDADGADN